MNSQTIVYHKPTGKILTTLQNRYIRHRKELLPLAPGTPLREIAFFYEPFPIDISTAEDHIRLITSGSPPQVFAKDGTSKSFDYFLQRRRTQVMAASKILCTFEGGMGDQILQSEAVLQFYEVFRGKKLDIAIYNQYFPVVQKIPGLVNLFPHGSGIAKGNYDLSVNMHTSHISDPRGGLYGKASLYGASLGLNKVFKRALLQIPPQHLDEALKKIGGPSPIDGAIKIGIHIRSGSGWGKCWNTEPAENLAKLFMARNNAQIFLFGLSKDWGVQHPQVYRANQRLQWIEIASIIGHLTLMICIDSGPMHLARAQGVNHLILWGGTSFKNILGREQNANDYRLDLPCIENLCYECPKGTPRCMTEIKPEDVYNKSLALILDYPLKKAGLYDQIAFHASEDLKNDPGQDHDLHKSLSHQAPGSPNQA